MIFAVLDLRVAEIVLKRRFKLLSFFTIIDLIKTLKSKKAIINMKNEDGQCFKWCVTRALNPMEKKPTKDNSRSAKTR